MKERGTWAVWQTLCILPNSQFPLCYPSPPIAWLEFAVRAQYWTTSICLQPVRKLHFVPRRFSMIDSVVIQQLSQLPLPQEKITDFCFHKVEHLSDPQKCKEAAGFSVPYLVWLDLWPSATLTKRANAREPLSSESKPNRVETWSYPLPRTGRPKEGKHRLV